MADELDHISLANRNHATLGALIENPNDHSEWITTIAFYKAVQVIEASFAFYQIGPSTSHGERLDLLKREKRYQHVYAHFRPLWQASTIARYLSDEDGNEYTSFASYIKPDSVVGKMVDHRLREVEQSIVLSKGLSETGLKTLRLLPTKLAR